MKAPLAIVLALFCAGSLAFTQSPAQSIPDFVPAKYVDTIPPALYQIINARYKFEIEHLKVTDRNKVYVKARAREMFDHTIENFNDEHMMVNSEISDYLSNIVERIAQANGFPSTDINIFAFRSEVPNAACYGNGILDVNLGLLARLDTEDEIAYIISHELAHHLSKDNIRGIERSVVMANDKEVKQGLRQARHSTYQQYTKARSILDQLDYTYTRHSRRHESSADSLGFLMYTKAGYDAGAALKALEVLRQADQDIYPPLDLEKFLSEQNIKVDPTWLQYTNPNRWHKDIRKPDSLRTHPNIEERTIAVSRMLSNLGYTHDGLNEVKDLRKNIYKVRAQLEMVEAEFHFRNYSTALYHAIQLSKMYPDNPWLKAMIGRCFYEIFTRQKNHTLRKSVDQPDAFFSESYNRLLTFIHKLRLPELQYIAYQYMTNQSEDAYKNEDFVYSLWLVSGFNGSKLDPARIKDDYNDLFPNGRYKRAMQ